MGKNSSPRWEGSRGPRALLRCKGQIWRGGQRLPPFKAMGTAGAKLNAEGSKGFGHTLVLAHACVHMHVCVGGGDGEGCGQDWGGGGCCAHTHKAAVVSPCGDLVKISRLLDKKSEMEGRGKNKKKRKKTRRERKGGGERRGREGAARHGRDFLIGTPLPTS